MSKEQDITTSSEGFNKTMKTTTTSFLQSILKLLMILISAGWVCVWLLKPTELWTKSWRKAEESARNTIFGYQGLDFVVYAFPVVAVVVTGFIYLHLHSKEQRSRQTRLAVTNLSNPVVINSPFGMISGVELLAAVVFTIFLGWTAYAHISKDFKKMTPVKSLKLNTWQYKFMRFGTRFGLLAEACLALLLLPVLRGLAIFRLIGMQFEASIRYHIFLGTAMIFFTKTHGLSTLFIWGIKHRLQDKVWKWQKTGRVYLAGYTFRKISEAWTISGTPLDLRDPRLLAMAAAERRFMEAEYDEYASTNAGGAAFCRSAALILMALLLLRHALNITNKLQVRADLVTSKQHGILCPTDKIYAKLVKSFLEADKVKELAEFLIKAAREDAPAAIENSAVVHMISVCISLGWLEKAHDLIDEMRFAGIKIGSSVYSSLLKAYFKENRTADISSLLRNARKAGIQLDSSCYEALIQSRVLQKDTQGALQLFKEMKATKISKASHEEFDMLVSRCFESGEAGLMAKLLEEIKEGQRADCGVHEWNSVIHFFCKKRLMQDAEKALKKMRALGHTPNAQTFHSLVTGYAAVGGKYIEVTELWGEMKSLASSSPMKFDQELLDSVLYTFVRGGFFLRANEVVEMMEAGDMFIDKYKYRTIFLKYHKTLYKKKNPKVQTEAQFKRREAAIEFKKWVGLS